MKKKGLAGIEEADDDREELERARGGRMDGCEERKRGGKVKEREQKRKHGGMVHGKKSEERPDRRARGGATGSPFSEAGKVSEPPFAHHRGGDRD